MLKAVFNRACNVIKKKLQRRCFAVKFAKFSGIPIFKNICERMLLFFQCHSHQHFLYHHFQYYRKMHLYCLRILLATPFDCNMIPCLFQLNLVFFFVADIFLSLIPTLLFFSPSKRTQNSFTTTRQILDLLFVLIFTACDIYTSLFTLNSISLSTFTYLYLWSLYTLVLT